MQSVFSDGKTFPDCLAKSDLAEIRQKYLDEKDRPEFDLQQFVATYFDEPSAEIADYQSDVNRWAAAHIAALWPVLTREPDAEMEGSLLPLPHPYIVPGGRFREIYYWDSYFTMLGLRQSGRTDLMQHMVDNFAHLINQIGHIPNGNRAYYLSRSQPPFFVLMVGLLAEVEGATVWVKYLPQLKREYAFWMEGHATLSVQPSAHRRVVRLADGAVLNRYWDDLDTPRPESYREDVELAHAEMYRHIRAAAESGWDFSSRWFADPHSFATICTTDLIPVDLNCLLWFLEKKLADTCDSLQDTTSAASYYAAAIARAEAIERYCWEEEAGFYFDFNFKSGKTSSHYTLAAVFSLFFNLASMSAAEQVAIILEKKFLQSGGLTTTLYRTGQQWDAPNGWAPLQWMAYQGLLQYDFQDLAAEVRRRWLATCENTYRTTGKMMEKYNVFGEGGAGGGGEYPNQDGFGWTNGVFLGMS